MIKNASLAVQAVNPVIFKCSFQLKIKTIGVI